MDRPNPLLNRSTLPHGLPDYPAIDSGHYLPAFEAAFADQRARVAEIVSSSDDPTFDNTLLALESSGELLGRVARTFYTVSSAHGTPEIQQIEETLAPLMSAHQDAIMLDARLFARVQSVHDGVDCQRRLKSDPFSSAKVDPLGLCSSGPRRWMAGS